MAWLTCTGPEGNIQQTPLTRDRTTMGRAADNHVVFPDLSVSRNHAVVLYRDGHYVLVDQNSSLGVVVNGEPAREHILQDGDRILLGRQALSFRDPASLPELTELEPEQEEPDPFAWRPDLQPLRDSLEGLCTDTLPPVGGVLQTKLQDVQNRLEALEENLSRAHHQHEIVRTLLRVSRLIHSTHSREKVLQLVVQLAVKVLGAERGFLMLHDPNSDELVPSATSNMNQEEQVPGSISHGIGRQVLEAGKGLRSDDAVADPRFEARHSVLDLGIRSVLCVPLRRRAATPLGVLYVDRLSSEAPFAPEDLEALAGLADVASVAIENAGLHQESARRIRAEEELKQAKELEVLKEDFFSMISHDLRTPLTSIKSWAEILLDDWERIEPEERKRYLGIVNRECDRLTRLIDELLDMERMESGRLNIQAHPCRPAEMLTGTAEAFAAAAQAKGIQLTSSWEPKLPDVLADPERITQVLTNLLNNALKFTPEGGTITMSARAASTQDPTALQGQTVTIDLNALRSARFVRFSVTDTGEGIPAEMQCHVFEKFRQVDAAQPGRPRGAGLGLSISREIVERHGGSIAVDSQVGAGSTFSFLLPVAGTE
jgi:signal transduction histidine kinase/pSer/pThr/pTyr-binding forkhead associated (FHA) protein